MDSYLPMLERTFQEATQGLFFKNNAWDAVQRRTVKILTQAEDEAQRRIETLQKSAEADLKSKLQTQRQESEAKLWRAIQSGNLARKQAVARANRYKAHYECLLRAVDSLLPGAKDLLRGKALLKADKNKALRKLQDRVALQRKRVKAKVIYSPEDYRDKPSRGYDKEARLLEALLVRQETLENKKSY